MGLFVMSERELGRLKIIEYINKQRISVMQGAELAGFSRRQMTRLLSIQSAPRRTGQSDHMF